MSAIRLLQAERQEEIQHLHRQLMSGGILQRELWEEAEKFLIQREIYDVALAEEQDLRAYKKSLADSGNYTKRQVKEQSSALRKIQQYWIETEYGEILSEIRECKVSDGALKGNIRRFLIRQGIHHIKEIDYTVRSRYEAELQK
ncbi:site-specific recombinase, phage integrase family, partial [gut metagenome]